MSTEQVMDEKESALRKEIEERVREIHKIRKESESFVPGKSKVNYAGRVYDEKEIIALVNSSIDFWLTLGEKGKEFEKNFANHLGVGKAIVCNSGSSANLLAVSALCTKYVDNPLKPGDEVITTAAAFPTTIAPIVQNNLIPVFVDVELGSYNIDVSKIEEAISPRTRAIFFAHTLGIPAEIDKIIEIAKKHNLYVIEDVCDALDSKYDGKYLGTFGDVATFSCYPAHHITMGEGGVVVTNNSKIARAVTSLRDWGRDCFCQTGEKNQDGACGMRFKHKFQGLPDGYDHKYVFGSIGYNLKPLDLQCAIGIEQLKKLPEFTEKRKKNFKRLYDVFKKFEDKFILPKWSEKMDVSWFAIPITVRENAGFSRKEFIEHLEGKMIETRMLFGGNILNQPGFVDIPRRVVGSLENSDRILRDSFFLGVYPGLTEEKLNYVCECIENFYESLER